MAWLLACTCEDILRRPRGAIAGRFGTLVGRGCRHDTSGSATGADGRPTLHLIATRSRSAAGHSTAARSLVDEQTGMSAMDPAPPLNHFAPTAPVCFISTHLDDVALSCGHFLAANPGATVVTVFAGAPLESRADGWNAETTGETYAPDALRVRRDEDASALAVVDATPYWLNLWEAEYLARPRRQRRSAGRASRLAKAPRYAVSKVRARARASSTRAQEPIVEALRRALAEIMPASVVAR
jgi:hypothetical protein